MLCSTVDAVSSSCWPILFKVDSIEKIRLRMVAAFNGNPSKTIIFNNAGDERDLDTFYNELSSFVRSVIKQNVLIIGGDMNTQIGKNVIKKNSAYTTRQTETGNT